MRGSHGREIFVEEVGAGLVRGTRLYGVIQQGRRGGADAPGRTRRHDGRRGRRRCAEPHAAGGGGGRRRLGRDSATNPRGRACFIRSSRLSAGNNARSDRRRGRRRESGAHHSAHRRFQTRARVLHLPRAVVAVDRRRCDGPQKLVAGNNRNQTTDRNGAGAWSFVMTTPRGSSARLKSGRALVAAGRGHGFRAGGR